MRLDSSRRAAGYHGKTLLYGSSYEFASVQSICSEGGGEETNGTEEGVKVKMVEDLKELKGVEMGMEVVGDR